jgi:hypothetical protein
MPQVSAGVAKPLRLGGESEHGLHHRERDQLGIGESWGDPHGWPPRSKMR